MKSLLFLFLGLFVSMTFTPMLPAFAVSYYSTDFNSGAPAEFSGYTATESVQGYLGYGPSGNQFSGDFLRNPTVSPIQITTLTLTGLPPHTGVDVGFLLAIIDSWDDGVCDISPAAAPDYFNVRVDGTVIFSETFENACGTQSYVPPAGVELARHLQLGFNTGALYYLDSAYDMGADPTFQNIPHTSSTLTIEWFSSGAGWQGNDDESWGLDNVRINLVGEDQVVGGEIIPINSAALLLAGAQSSLVWITPVILAGAGVIAFKLRRN